jgi:hypothetical protein
MSTCVLAESLAGNIDFGVATVRANITNIPNLKISLNIF